VQQRAQHSDGLVRSVWGKGANPLNVTEIKASLVGIRLSNTRDD